MQHALALASDGIGRCAPNPTVGCVIVKNNHILGKARTANGGRPHAETQALQQAGEEARGATLYATLEPCCHHGQTPPCVDAIISAGISRIVIAMSDPYPKVDGGGIAALKDAGIAVELGEGAAQAIEINRGFFSRVKRLRPWVTLKVATSADNFIAPTDGSQLMITNEASRRHVHHLRAANDAILTGSGTYLADNPQLTVRVDGLESASPQRHLLDRRGRIETSPFTIRKEETLTELLHAMAKEGTNYLMVEAGAELSRSFLQEGLIDELYWYQAPHLLEQGIEVFHGSHRAIQIEPYKTQDAMFDSDKLHVYRFTNPHSLIGD